MDKIKALIAVVCMFFAVFACASAMSDLLHHEFGLVIGGAMGVYVAYLAYIGMVTKERNHD